MATTLYKITGPQGEPLVATSSDRWPLPRKRGRYWQAGEWTPDREPALCESGWHLLPVAGLSVHVGIGMLWEAEGRGESVGDATKTAFRRARLLRPVGEITHELLVLATCDWAEHVQPDPVPKESREAIAAARAWAACPCEEHRVGADRAAYAAFAANAAARTAAADAAFAANAAYRTAVAAAGTDAVLLGLPTASFAANAAARSARDERTWQGERLLELVTNSTRSTP